MLMVFLKELKYRWFEYFLGSIITAVIVTVFIIQFSLSKSAENQLHTISHNLGNNMLVVHEKTDMPEFYAHRFADLDMPESYSSLALESEAGAHIKNIGAVLYENIEIGGVPAVLTGRTTNVPESESEKRDITPAFITEMLSERTGAVQGSILNTGKAMYRIERVIPADSMTSDYGIVVRLSDAQRITGKNSRINALYIGGCWCSIDIPALGKMIEGSLPGTKAVTLAGMVAAQKGAIAVMVKYSDLFYIAAIVMLTGTILLLVFSQIRRYKREFGLFVVLGISGQSIQVSFWARSFFTGITGGAAGYIAGVLLTGYLSGFFPSLEGVPVSGQLLPAAGIILLSCLLGAIIPAYTISELDPVETLREE